MNQEQIQQAAPSNGNNSDDDKNNNSVTAVKMNQNIEELITSTTTTSSSTTEATTTTTTESSSNPTLIIPLPNDDLDILIKMERANKEMENNQKSAQSILLSNNSIGSGSGCPTATTNNNNTTNVNSSSSPTSHSLSRRASFTSCESSSINNEDNLSKMDEISWELWNQIINDWLTWSKKKAPQLKEYIRKGIPLYLRPLAWQYLCGANTTDSKDKFKEYLKKSSSCEKLIRRDIDRTYPDHDFFRNPVGQESLFNVMKAYSIHDPEVGYCQGSAFICGLLLIQNIPEEETFAIFVEIMQHYNLREIYKPNMYNLGLCMYQLDVLLQESLPDLHRHFLAHAFHTSMYSSSWFLTLFTTSLPLPLVCRIFDIFLNEGLEIVFRIGLAILELHKDNLILLDMEGMLKYFQKELPTKHENDHDGLLNKAFAIKYNQKKMKKLEKDFSILKKEEQEEQVEMRRLRAENKLLKQRIDNLEKESANLAERLIKGQVTNAQNAESIYVLKNDNQKLKDKLNELQMENESSMELRRKQQSAENSNNNEKEMLHEKVNMLLIENSKLRETPDTQRLEEELVQVKMREAEAQLAIKELQKTIHVLNLEYQEFLNNRGAVVVSLSNNTPPISSSTSSSNLAASSAPSPTTPSSNSTQNGNSNSSSQINGIKNINDYQVLEEELLKVKMREAETLSEMKSLNLKLMQLETEKQVAYNQLKRQDEEIRKLNSQIQQLQEKESEMKSQLTEYRRQLDDKEAQLKESSMTHKLQEAEAAHSNAELRQRVAALEVQIQELVTTGQLNAESEKNLNLFNVIGTSTDKLMDFNEDMKYMLMSSTNSLYSEKNYYKPSLRHMDSLEMKPSHSLLNDIKSGIKNQRLANTQPSTPTTTKAPVNLLSSASDITRLDESTDGSTSSSSSNQKNHTKIVNRSRSSDEYKNENTKQNLLASLKSVKKEDSVDNDSSTNIRDLIINELKTDDTKALNSSINYEVDDVEDDEEFLN